MWSEVCVIGFYCTIKIAIFESPTSGVSSPSSSSSCSSRLNRPPPLSLCLSSLPASSIYVNTQTHRVSAWRLPFRERSGVKKRIETLTTWHGHAGSLKTIGRPVHSNKYEVYKGFSISQPKVACPCTPPCPYLKHDPPYFDWRCLIKPPLPS